MSTDPAYEEGDTIRIYYGWGGQYHTVVAGSTDYWDIVHSNNRNGYRNDITVVQKKNKPVDMSETAKKFYATIDNKFKKKIQ